MAVLYHQKRNYLSGYYPALVDLARKSDIRIEKCQRIAFGGLYHDGWSVLVYDTSEKK